MKLGIVFPQTEIGPDPERIVRFVRAVEDAGFDHLLAYDHVIGADTRSRPEWTGTYSLEDEFHEPLVLFGYIAALTRLELATCILVLPQRQTVLVAKQAAEVDLLTRGRFRLGVGIGWNTVEYEALGRPFRQRASGFEPQIELLRRLWTTPSLSAEGPDGYVDRAGLRPLPAQRPIPVWLGGGASRRVAERIGRLADGWMPRIVPGPDLDRALRIVRDSARSVGRDPGEIGLQGIVHAGDLNGERIRRHWSRWQEVGATHVAFSTMGAGFEVDDHLRCVALLRDLMTRA